MSIDIYKNEEGNVESGESRVFMRNPKTKAKIKVFDFIWENNITEFCDLVNLLKGKADSFMIEDVLESPYIYIEYINSCRRRRGMV